MNKILLCCILLLFIPPSCYASWYSGIDLKILCSSNTEYNKGVCVGFIAAAASSAENRYFCKKTVDGRELLKQSAFGDCEDQKQIALPQKIKLKQALDIVFKYLNDNPAELHKSAESLVGEAMVSAFGLRKVEQ